MDSDIISFFRFISLDENQSDVISFSFRLIGKVKRNELVVSKTIHTMKYKQETKESEESKLNFLNLSESAKNRCKKSQTETVDFDESDVETANSISGWYSLSTWYKTIHLYDAVCNNKLLESKQRDEVQKILFGFHTFCSLNEKYKTLYSFFINQACISIFHKISKRHILQDKTIDKLMECITDFEGLLSVFNLGKETFVNTLFDLLYDQYWNLKKLRGPDFVVTFFKEIREKTVEENLTLGFCTSIKKKEFNQDELEKLIIKHLNGIRSNAVEAVYNNARRRNSKAVLTENRLNRIQECAKNPEKALYADRTFTEYVFCLVELSKELDHFDYKKTFTDYLSILEKKWVSFNSKTIPTSFLTKPWTLKEVQNYSLNPT